ncbi:MAG: HNH endonuclease [Roseibium sp.]|uniref:HNH endonuclease n=1 Tax=Roseibium sp. TaxID=1936156 RepID=UPI002620210F|nr:HNH endonuclease [Roseibium sp.]MCV0428180.1 HNH endonuclease [Roseibium sp.]
MISRSPEFYFVAYALSRLSEPDGAPPSVLGVQHWVEAYDLFYESVGDGRESHSFRNSLKNARDAFDAFMPDSPRTGWRDSAGNVPEFKSGRFRETLERWDQEPAAVLNQALVEAVQVRDAVEVEDVVFTEGREKIYVSRRRERAAGAREAAISIHGQSCQACGFNFKAAYGDLGRDFIEVHHAVPLAEKGRRKTNPSHDLIVLCSNCHRMAHRKRGYCLSLDELKAALRAAQENSSAE